MDALGNPYRPGAGTRPPALTGRDDLLRDFTTALRRAKGGKPGQSLMPTGLRGVGKTVLLGEFAKIAAANQCAVISIEATHDGKFVEMLGQRIRAMLLDFDRGPASKFVIRALGALKSFSLTEPHGFKIALDIDGLPGVADSGVLSLDLVDLFVATGEAARDRSRALLIQVDEIQFLGQGEFEALIVALHRTTQLDLPVVLVGAGLPQLPALSGAAKSYAERLFTFPSIGALDSDAAAAAIVEPASELGVEIEVDAVRRIIERSGRYPYFLQEYAYAVWNAAAGPATIVEADVAVAEAIVAQKLDDNFFSVRIESLTPAQLRYVNAMASLGEGPYPTADIASAVDASTSSVSRLREDLIGKGIIFSPNYGVVAFTVPQFDEFLRRRAFSPNVIPKRASARLREES